MKTKLTWGRCKPTQTAKLFSEIASDATAWISEWTPNDPFQTLASIGWVEVDRETLFLAARNGYDVWYKTASLAGKARYYVYLGSQHITKHIDLKA